METRRFQRSMSLIEMRPRHNRRSFAWMRSFKDTPQIHFIIPLSAVTSLLNVFSNNWPGLTAIQKQFSYAHVEDIPSKFCSDCTIGEARTQLSKCFPRGDNSCKDCVRTTTTLAKHITNIIEGGFDIKSIILDVNFFKGCNSRRHNLSRTFMHAKFLLSVRRSVFPEQLLWTHRSHDMDKLELAPTPQVYAPKGYFGLLTEILLCSALEIWIWFCWHLHVSQVIQMTSSRLKVCF